MTSGMDGCDPMGDAFAESTHDGGVPAPPNHGASSAHGAASTGSVDQGATEEAGHSGSSDAMAGSGVSGEDVTPRLGGAGPTEPPQTPAERKQVLLRKVAMLTKVVVHLTARTEEGEAQEKELREGFEDEIKTLTHDALDKIRDLRGQLAPLLDADALREEATRCASEVGAPRQALLEELRTCKEEAAARLQSIRSEDRCKRRSDAAVLRQEEGEVRRSVAAFLEVAGRSRAEHERRNAELRERRAQELRTLASEHERRLADLRAAQAREVEQMHKAREQALVHFRRQSEAEISALRSQGLQRRREKAFRMEQDFNEHRRTAEQLIAHMEFELEQQRQEMRDVELSGEGVLRQVTAMRSTLDEMRRRVEQSAVDAAAAQEEATQKEAEAVALQSELALLNARHRAAGSGCAAASARASATGAGDLSQRRQPRGGEAAAPGADIQAGTFLSEELREAIATGKQAEAELAAADTELAELEESLVEHEKQVEILEVELEEEILQTHRLQARLLELDSASSRPQPRSAS